MAAKLRIKDIADQLEVSTATVSRALNDKPGVSDELRQRINELAAKLDFTPNIVARNLVGGRTGAVAFILHRQAFPVSSDPFYFLIMRGVERELDKAGYHVVLSTVGNKPDGDNLRVVRERRVDGLILAGPDIDPSLVMSLTHLGLPAVLVDNAMEHIPMDCVLCDDREGARMAVEHLLSHGYKQIIFVGGPTSWLSTREREKGYADAMQAAGLPIHVMHESATTLDAGLAASRKLFARKDRPAAVYAVNDAMAMGVIRAAGEAGLKVPGDLAVAGFDDVSIAASTDPPLTTVRVDKEIMGELAARRLLELVENKQQPYCKVIVGTKLILRQSCGCAVSEEEVVRTRE
jgi:DNA-binding LacI/PurR family transcriptional regulator